MKINKELALEGMLLKAVNPLPYEKMQRLLCPVSSKVLGILPLKSLNCKKVMIKRGESGSFRACVMRGKGRAGKTIGVLWLHGGGYILGAPEMAVMSFPKQLINNCNCVIVAPDYTLSGISPYPAALNDAYAALQWMKENRENLGIECEKLVVGGESAGGGLCAALCIYARDNGEDCIGLQLPLYPMLDDRVTETSADNNAPVWNTRANKSAWKIYLGDRVMNNSVEPYAAPARETDYSKLPPAVSIIGTAEPFYAETITYFKNLSNAGIPVALKEFEGAYHAFDMLAPYASISKKANRFLLEKYLEFTNKVIKQQK